MKSVLMSINPKYCELIAAGKKTIEVRKTRPKIETPFKCYIYCTKEFYRKGDGYFQGKYCGKVIGEFDCNIIEGGYLISPWGDFIQKETCLTYAEINKYAGNKPLWSWHISDLVIYDNPKELSKFANKSSQFIFSNDGVLVYKGMTRPPQSWCYVEEIK